MPTLIDCLKKAGKLFSPVEQKRLLAEHDRYVNEGFEPHAASAQTVTDHIKSFDGDLRSIIEQTKPAPPAPAATTQPTSPPPSVAGANAPVAAAADAAKSNAQSGTEMPVPPVAQAPAGVASVLDLVANQKAAVAKGEAHPGGKVARLYEDTDSVDELVKDAHAAGNKSSSRKLGVLLSPNGETVMIGTVSMQPKGGAGKGLLTPYITAKAGEGKTGKTLDSLLAKGWSLVAAIKTDEPTKGYFATHSVAEWQGLAEELRVMRGAQGRTAEAMSDTIARGREFGNNPQDHPANDHPTGDDTVEAVQTLGGVALADVAADTVTVEVTGFRPEHAEAIYDDIKGIKSADEVLPAIKSKRATNALFALGRLLLRQKLTPEQVAHLIKTKIYEAYIHRAEQSAKGFAESLNKSLSATPVGPVSSPSQKNEAAHPEGAGRTDGGRSSEAGGPGSSGQGSQTGSNNSGQDQVKKPGAVAVISIDGLSFAIQKRRGQAFYGEITGTEGHDGDPLDAYIGPNPGGAKKVWVIDQKRDDGKFDEHKAMVGFNSKSEAQAAYEAGFSDGHGGRRIGAITEMDRQEFVDWVNEGGHEDGPVAYGKKARLTRNRKFITTLQGLAKAIGDGAFQFAGLKDVKSKDLVKVAQQVRYTGQRKQIINAVYFPQAQRYSLQVERKFDVGDSVIIEIQGYPIPGVVKGYKGDKVLVLPSQQALPLNDDVRIIAVDKGRVADATSGINVHAATARPDWTTQATAVPHLDLNKSVTESEHPHSSSWIVDSSVQYDDLNAAEDRISGFALGDIAGFDGFEDESADARRRAFEESLQQEAGFHDIAPLPSTGALGEKNERQSTAIYQAIYTWAHNNSFKIVPDFSTSFAGNYRRNAQQLSSAIRYGSTEHLLPTEEQFERMGVTPKEWQSLSFNDQIKAMIRAEMSFVEQSLPEIKGFTLGADGAFYDQGKRVGDVEALKEHLKSLASKQQTDVRVGVATVKRYLAERAVLEEGKVELPEDKLALKGLLYRKAPAVPRLTSDEVTRKFKSVIERLRVTGVNYQAVKAGIGEMVQEFGQYQEWESHSGELVRMVTLAMSDVNLPSTENYVTLLHEVWHMLAANESPEVQQIMAEAITKLTNQALGIDANFAENLDGVLVRDHAHVLSEGRMAEAIAQEFAANGFDPAASRSVVRQIFRMVKALYYQAAMKMMKALGMRPSSTLVLGYANTRMQQFLAGESGYSFTSFAGGSMAEPVTRNRKLDYASAEETGISPDVNSTAEVERDVAAQNEVSDTLNLLFKAFNDLGHNPMGLTLEQFFASGNFVKLDKIPSEVIASVQATLAAAGQAGVDPTLRVKDVTNDSMKLRAAQVAHKVLDALYTWGANKSREVRASIKSTSERLDRSNTRLSQLVSDYTNADTMLQIARADIKTLFKDMTEAAKSWTGDARKLGRLGQVITELEGKIDQPLLNHYAKVINGLYAKLTGEGGRKFIDLMSKVADLNVDWELDSTKKIRDTIYLLNDPELAPLKLDTEESKAALAVAIAFGKSNAMFMDLLIMRRAKADVDRSLVDKALRLAMLDHADAVTEARKLTQNLPRLARVADRLLTRLKAEKDNNYELLDQVKRDSAFIAFHHDTAPLLHERMAQLEKIPGVTLADWQPDHNAPVMAAKPGMNQDQVAAAIKPYDHNAPAASVREMLADMKAWMDTVPVDKRGAIWNTVAMQYQRISQHDIETGLHRPIQTSFVNRYFGDMPDRLRFIGSPSARSAAMRWAKKTFWEGTMLHRVRKAGPEFEVAESKAQAALGIARRDTFTRLIYNPALKYMESRQDILAANKDTKVAEGLVIDAALKYLATDTRTAKMMARPGAESALRKLLQQTTSGSQIILQNQKDTGIKVLDDQGDYKYYREAIGAAPYTLFRTVSDAAHQLFKTVLQPQWGEDLTVKGLEEAWHKDPAQLQADLALKFTPEIMEKFVRPIVERPGKSAFNAPIKPDGSYVRAMRERVMRAFDSSGGDIIQFAKNLYQLEGGTGELSAFIGDTLETLQEFKDTLQALERTEAEKEERGLPNMGRILADARKSEELPAEWLNYMRYDTHSMRQMAKSQAYQAAFGRNLEGMRSDLDNAKAEQVEFLKQYNTLKDQFDLPEGKKLDAAIKAEAIKQKLNWSAISQARINLAEVGDASDKFDAMLSLNRNHPPEIAAWSELIGGLAGMLVQAPGSALSDTIAMFEQPFRRFGFSPEAFKLIGRTSKASAVRVFGGLGQAVHQTIKADADYSKLLLDVGLFDEAAMLTLKQRFKAMMVEPTSSKLLKPAVMASRVGRILLSHGAGKAVEGAGAVFPSLKPHAPFTYQAQVIHEGNTIGWWKQYESYIAKALKHFAAHPEDLANPNFQFTGKELGLSGRAWDFVKESTGRFGLGLEQIAKEAYHRRQADPTARLMSVDQYRALSAFSQNEITLETNSSTRLPWMQTTREGAMAAPFLGWAVSKGYDAWRGFREPNGQASWRAFRTGLLPYAAILPIGLAYALMRDEYDEQIVGKKRNVRDLTTIKDAPDAFLTMLDNAARMGTFGIAGEMVNQTFNYDTQRPISLDNRILLVSTLLNIQSGVSNWIRQGNADWATVGRPMSQALGGGGYLQYADIINNALGLDNAEARASNRISVGNYLRVTGRVLDMDVRNARSAAAMPNPMRPFIGQMVMAALANNAPDFMASKQAAMKEAMSQGRTRDEALDYVQRAFKASHPLYSVFKTPPSEKDYKKLLAAMNDSGRQTVATAVRMFNHYGEQVRDARGNGIAPSTGRVVKSGPALPLDALRARAVSSY